ncbi:branchpoint-bridging [Fusarium albosuccineum]|uniref:Branchpoint-bridging protein n=1 Tax=Fusarium albosuccineum TaxID=1237068 RepID=A0A8H4L9H0_9HYPO|nr:branchpoint-bridging [Fusarium albosuccineum]
MPSLNSKRGLDSDLGQSKRRRGRWGSQGRGTTAGSPTAITSTMTSEQLDAYICSFRIDEITGQLRARDLSLPVRRSPSPAPEYDRTGRRTNTREQRYRGRLEEERHQLIETALRTIPAYRPPYDYRRPMTKISEKILGPRGSSLKAMNDQSGANIVIRGKGSVKEGRGKARSSGGHDDSEPLHCLITADSQHKVDQARKLVEGVIETATSTPEHQNQRKLQQLRDLAMINGTFRDDENQLGQARGGRLIEYPKDEAATDIDQQPVTNISKDKATILDHEYHQLMSEIETGHSLPLDGCTTSSSSQQTKPLPPWRVDRYGRGDH